VKKISHKLLIFLCLPITCFLIVVFGILFIQTKGIALNLTEKMSTEILKGKADQISTYIEGLEVKMNTYLNGAWLLKDAITLEAWEMVEPEFRHEIENNRSLYQEVFAVDVEGGAYSSKKGVIDLKNSPSYKKIIRENKKSFLGNYQEGKKDTMVFAKELIDDAGKKIGLYAVRFYTSGIKSLVENSRIDNHGNSWLVSSKGEILISPSRNTSDDMVSTIVKSGSLFSKPEAFIVENQNIAIFDQIKGFDQYGIILSVKQSSLFSSVDKLTRFILVLAGIAIVIFVLFSLLVGKLIAKPTKTLKDAIDRFKNGEFNVDIHLKGQDEIAEVGGALKKMGKTLHDSLQSIQQYAQHIEDHSQQNKDFSLDSRNKSKAVSNKTVEIRDGLEDFTAELEAFRENVEVLSKRADNLAELSDKYKKSFEKIVDKSNHGQKTLQRSFEISEETVDKINITKSSVDKLISRTMDVERILNTIEEMTEKTNFLALNASIEAARVGEAGKGFAVVAEEIQKLVKDEKMATGEISEIIEEIKAHSHETENLAEDSRVSVENDNVELKKALKEFGDIGKLVNDLEPNFEKMQTVIDDQDEKTIQLKDTVERLSEEIINIHNDMEKISQSSEEQVRISNQVSDSSESLYEISFKLGEINKQFVI